MWDFDKLKEKETERRLFHIRLAAVSAMVIALLVLGGGCSKLASKLQELEGAPQASQSAPQIPTGGLSTLPSQTSMTTVRVYFKDQQGHYLVPTTVEVDKAPGIAREALNALFRGPAQGIPAVASVPAGVQVKTINIKTDGTCVVDLAPLPSKMNLTAKDEALAVYAMVDTLTEFSDVKRVQFLVNGRKKKTLAGHIPIDQPLLRNLTFVETTGS